MKKKSLFKLLALSFMFIGTVIMPGCGNTKVVSLNPYVDVDVTGLDGYANAMVSVDYSEIEDAVLHSLAPNPDDLSVEAGLEFLYVAGEVAECVSFSANPTSGLKNGDIVTVTAEIDDEYAKELGIKFSFEDIKYKVNGLQEPIVISKDTLFKDVNLSVSGVSPYLEVNVVNESVDPVISNIHFYLDKNYNLREGETVTVSAEITSDYEKQNIIFEDVSKDFVLENVDAYLFDIEDLTENDVEDLLVTAESAINKLTNKEIDECFYVGDKFWALMNSYKTMSTPVATKVYLMSLKPEASRGALGSTENLLGIVYKFDVKSLGGGMLEKPAETFPEGYIMLYYANTILTKDGEIVIDTNSEEFTPGYSTFANFERNQILPIKDTGDYIIEEIELSK